MTQQALATTVIHPIRVPVPIRTVHVVLAPNGKNNEENIAVKLTSEEYSFIKASSNAKQTRFTEEEYEQLLTNIDKRQSIFTTALKRAGIKGKRQVQVIERLDD